jgi:xanthine dehydrogenase accessory factor
MRFFERVAELERDRVPFALALVVSRRAPVSSHVGDRAVVFADGRMEGFVGGSCSRDIVRRHGVEALRTGTPRLLHISPVTPSLSRGDAKHDPASADAPGAEHIFVPMSCASEGAADVYLEPHLPSRRLIVAGFTPVAEALARVGSALDYEVLRVVDDREVAEFAGSDERVLTLGALAPFVRALSATERSRTAAVVASLGHYDEAALGALLDVELGFVGLVASRKRAARVFGVLEQEGRSAAVLSRVHNPVGLDIGARAAGDVAISILAEIVAAPLPMSAPATPQEVVATSPATGVDVICGMDVEIDGARHRFELDGRTYYFCCAGCRATFAADPQAALAASGNA